MGLNELLAWIEARLDEPLTLDAIAAQAGLSPYHFSRLFTARMGRSVMAYARGRRLIRGARRLVAEPDIKLIDLAFDGGFESQEAFTRAFRRLFGVSPGRFRQGFSLQPIEGQYPMNAPSSSAVSASVVQLPEPARLEAFTVAGPARRFGQEDKSEIPQLWSVLVGVLPFEGQRPGWATYGVVWSADREEGTFAYMAGVEVEPGCALPKAFDEKRIPAATYMVFRISLDGSALHPQVKSAMVTIWGELIPASGVTVADSPDFELYDGHFSPNQPGAVIDFYVPIEA